MHWVVIADVHSASWRAFGRKFEVDADAADEAIAEARRLAEVWARAQHDQLSQEDIEITAHRVTALGA
jgi:hypothetical protein